MKITRDLLFQHHPCPLLFLEADGQTVKEVNPAFLAQIGQLPDNIPLTLESLFKKAANSNAGTGDTGFCYFTDRNGTRKLVELKTTPAENSDETSRLVAVREVSEALQAENKQLDNLNYRSLLESAPDAIIITDENGTINFCNRKMEALFGYREKELLGQPVERLIPESFHRQHLHKRRRYMRKPSMRPMGSNIDLYGVKKDGTELPVDIMLGPLQEEDGLSVLAIIRDISKHKRSQVKLTEEKVFVRLLHHLTVVSNQAKSVLEAMQQSIDEICSYMNWPVGHAYLPSDYDPRLFIPTDVWHLDSETKFESFYQITQKSGFRSGQGLIGRVIETGRPHWIADVHEDARFHRRGLDYSLPVRAGFALPVLVEDEVVGVLEFFSTEVMPSDALLLEKMATIGTQIGRVVERKKAESQLVRSETKFKLLFESASDAIFLMKGERFIDCNSRTLEIFGCSRDEILNEPPYRFSPEKQPDGQSSHQKAKEKINAALAGNPQSFEWKHSRLDGTLFDAEVSLNRISLQGELYVQAIVRDITERKQSERLVQQNMELFSQLFQNSPVGVAMLNEDNKVENINKSFEHIFGYTLKELKGRNIDRIIARDSLRNEASSISTRTYEGDSFQIETTRLRKDGTEVPVLIAGVPVIVEGKTIAIFGIYVDISERMRAEQKVRESLKEKEVMLAEIHHRVKNNLAVISGLLELQKYSAENPHVQRVMQDSQSRIHSMALVHEQLYQMEMFSELQLDDYVSVLFESISSTFEDPHTEIYITLKADPVKLTISQAVPCGLLLNELLTNVYKHAFPDQEEGRLTVQIEEKGGQVTLRVSDDGVGLPDNINFDHPSSLGLKLIQSLSRQLDADLHWETVNGTSFTVSFMLED